VVLLQEHIHTPELHNHGLFPQESLQLQSICGAAAVAAAASMPLHRMVQVVVVVQ